MSLKIILDIDDTINYWLDHYKKWYNTDKYPKHLENHVITRNVYKLRDNKDFWLSVPVARYPDFEIVAYCTKRINKKNITREWLLKNGFQDAPIYQQYYQGGSKSKLIKGRCDVFIDDSISNFLECNSNGVFTLLIDAPHNQGFNTPFRIHSLEYREIEEKYYLIHNASN